MLILITTFQGIQFSAFALDHAVVEKTKNNNNNNVQQMT